MGHLVQEKMHLFFAVLEASHRCTGIATLRVLFMLRNDQFGWLRKRIQR